MVPVTKATWVACWVATLALVYNVARAEAGASRIAIESYSGPRPREGRQAMAALRDALAARRFVSQPSALAELMGEQAPRPGVSDRQFTARIFAREIDAGENLYIDENYKAAASQLGATIDRAHRNPEILREAQSRELKLKGLVLLAQSAGFNFETEIARKREGELARRLAYRLGGAMVAVLTVSQSRRRLAIAGSVYAVWSGRLVRSGMVELGTYHDAAKIEQLAGYLDPSTDASAAKLVIPLAPGDYVPTPIEEIRSPVDNAQRFAADGVHIERAAIMSAPAGAPVRHWPEIALVGTGLLAGGLGAYLVATDGDMGTAGWAITAAGAVAIGIGAWLHLRHPSRLAVVAAPGHTGGVALASWRF